MHSVHLSVCVCLFVCVCPSARPPLPEVSLAAGRDHLLEKVSRSLSSSHVKFGSAGSMPLAPLHSHLAVKNSTHLQRRGRADIT